MRKHTAEERTLTAAEAGLQDGTEIERIERWRAEELERAGYDGDVAQMLSELRYVDLHRAMLLLRQGCPAETALKILV